MRTLIALLSFAVFAGAQSVESIAKAYRTKPSAQGRASLLRFASVHPKDVDGALALFTLGVTGVEAGDYDEAIQRLEQARARLPQIADHVAFHIGTGRMGLKDYSRAIREWETVWRQSPPSPLLPKSVLLAVEAFLAAGAPADAISILGTYYDRLPQPAAGLALASALEAAGNLAGAASHYQKVFYGYPAHPEALEAATALERVRQNLGSSYPPPMPADMLERADRWIEAGEYTKAREEFETLVPQLGGEHRDLARVGIGVADYRRGRTRDALDYLSALRVDSPEADARRLYYLVACSRQLGDRAKALESIESLGRQYPQSGWRIQALVWVANGYLLENDPAGFEPLYRACYEDFPRSPQADYCHWKLTWHSYLRRDSRAGARLREYIERFPQGEKTAAALYFLGRLSEADAKAEARSCYEAVIHRFPLHFYRSLAEKRLQALEPAPAGSSPASATLASGPSASFQPSAETRYWTQRARLLELAGMPASGDAELRFASSNGAQRGVLAMGLARSAARRGEFGQSLRHIKGVFPGYLSVAFEAAPIEFWRLAFPLPYRGELERLCRARKLDPWLIAGLIRQESEFDPNAVSRAGARGLMQVLPSTGRSLSRRVGLKRFRPSLLARPEVNILLGTYYFSTLLDEFDGRVEEALASYNGGKSRVEEWVRWAAYNEPAEFVENIPLTETRGYVQAVLRNAQMYRLLYGAESAKVTSTNGVSGRRNASGP